MSRLDAFFPHALISCDEIYEWEHGLFSHLLKVLPDTINSYSDKQGNLEHCCLMLQRQGLSLTEIVSLLSR